MSTFLKRMKRTKKGETNGIERLYSREISLCRDRLNHTHRSHANVKAVLRNFISVFASN